MNWYSDIPKILAENEYIDAELRERWIQIIGFRNVLVHDYLDIDRKIVYEALQHRLDDLERITKGIRPILVTRPVSRQRLRISQNFVTIWPNDRWCGASASSGG